MAKIQIEIDNDGAKCGECPHYTVDPESDRGPMICIAFDEWLTAIPTEHDAMRCQLCLDAEVREPIKLTEHGGL